MKKIIFSLLFIFLMISCALESKFGLPNDEKINPELIGTWYDGKKHNESLIIEKFGENRYKLILNDSTEFISYSKKIKGFNILNVMIDYKGEKTNTFYGFEFKNEKLKFSEVNDKLRKDDFNSQAELTEFFLDNIDKEEFFINPTELIKK